MTSGNLDEMAAGMKLKSRVFTFNNNFHSNVE